MKRIISYTICGIVLATTLNSCHIYKKYERPEVDVQGLFRDTVSVTDTLAADSLNIGNLPWTEIFTDPILQGLIRQGLENNSDLQSAMLQVEAAQASFRAAQLAFLPSLNLAPQGGVSSFDGSKATWTYNVPVTASRNAMPKPHSCKAAPTNKPCVHSSSPQSPTDTTRCSCSTSNSLLPKRPLCCGNRA